MSHPDRIENEVLRWDGCEWTPQAMPDPTTLIAHAVWGSGPNDVWLVGSGAQALHFNGLGFSLVSTGAFHELLAVSGTGPDDVWAVGSSVIHWDGTSWTPVAIPGLAAGSTVTDVWAVAPDDVWLVEFTNAYHFDGSTWTKMLVTDAGGALTLSTIWADHEQAFAAGLDSDFVFHFENGSWSSPDQPPGPGVRDLGGREGHFYAVGDPSPAVRVLRGTELVEVRGVPQVSYASVWVSRYQVWAAGSAGTIIHRVRPSPPTPLSPMGY